MAEKPSSKPMAVSYLHSFFMTENYVIFTEQPWILGDLGNMIIQHVLKGTLDSGINVPPWINVAPGTFGKNNKHSLLNKHSPPLK